MVQPTGRKLRALFAGVLSTVFLGCFAFAWLTRDAMLELPQTRRDTFSPLEFNLPATALIPATALFPAPALPGRDRKGASPFPCLFAPSPNPRQKLPPKLRDPNSTGLTPSSIAPSTSYASNADSSSWMNSAKYSRRNRAAPQ